MKSTIPTLRGIIGDDNSKVSIPFELNSSPLSMDTDKLEADTTLFPEIRNFAQQAMSMDIPISPRMKLLWKQIIFSLLCIETLGLLATGKYDAILEVVAETSIAIVL